MKVTATVAAQATATRNFASTKVPIDNPKKETRYVRPVKRLKDYM